MQKKLIALAIAGLVSAPVFAQSNVTVYGIVDAFMGYGKTGDNKFTGIESGGLAGSRLGFKGSEDLGNGLKAVFTLEYGLDVDANQGVGTGGLRGRQQFVGLQGDFGFVGLGRQYSPGYFIFKYDPLVLIPMNPQFLLAGKGAGSNIVAASPARVSNSINYKSPSFAGLSVNAIYGFAEGDQVNNRRKGDLAAVGADYANGPISAGLIYSQVNDQASDDNKQEWYLGGAYDLGVVKLSASYQRIEDATAAKDTDKVWQIGGAVPVSAAGKVIVSYGRLDADADNSDAKAWTVLYTHSLSKRTTAYAAYGQIRNDDGQAIATFGGNGSFGDTSRNVAVGLNHTF